MTSPDLLLPNIAEEKKFGLNLEQHLARLAEAGPAAIQARLRELDDEWSVGRMTKAVSGVIILAGLVPTLLVNPWFALVPAVGGLILAQYLFAKRSWLGEAFRDFGYRSGCEIDQEKVALKALRGDFRNLPTIHEIEDQVALSRLEGEGGIVADTPAPTFGPLEAAKELVEATRN
jgi:hypothetical protein